MAKSIKGRNIDGDVVDFVVGEFVEFKCDIEQCSKILDVRSGSVLVDVTEGGYGRGKTWMAMSDCWTD